MAKIIETLSLIPSESPYFTVDADAVSVDLEIPTQEEPAFTYLLHNANGYTYFELNDNIRILSFGLMLPENFVLAKAPLAADYSACPSFILQTYRIVGITPTIGTIPAFSEYGLEIPIENYEHGIDIFFDVYAKGYAEKFSLQMLLGWPGANTKPKVSMVNAPSILDASKQTCICFVKVLHNFPMTVLS